MYLNVYIICIMNDHVQGYLPPKSLNKIIQYVREEDIYSLSRPLNLVTSIQPKNSCTHLELKHMYPSDVLMQSLVRYFVFCLLYCCAAHHNSFFVILSKTYVPFWINCGFSFFLGTLNESFSLQCIFSISSSQSADKVYLVL